MFVYPITGEYQSIPGQSIITGVRKTPSSEESLQMTAKSSSCQNIRMISRSAKNTPSLTREESMISFWTKKIIVTLLVISLTTNIILLLYQSETLKNDRLEHRDNITKTRREIHKSKINFNTITRELQFKHKSCIKRVSKLVAEDIADIDYFLQSLKKE